MRSPQIALASGVLFAFGLVVSGMTSPAKVTAFLDVTGAWNPALVFVMAGAIAVYTPIVRLVRGRRAPIFGDRFHWPTASGIDARLVVGSALFGVGWGLSGYCPGPALVSLGGGSRDVLVFVGAMLVGIAGTRLVVAIRR